MASALSAAPPPDRGQDLIVDVIDATTVPTLGTEKSVRDAVQNLLDRAAIQNLAALYALSRDDHDIEGLMQCFAEDGAFIHDREPIRGHIALREYYLGNMRSHAFSIHTPHSHLINFAGPERATGVVTGHGEFADTDRLTVCAYRYFDTYVKLGERWFLSERGHDFVYYLPVEELSTVGRDEDRIRRRWGGSRRAEWLPRPV